jgi:hypothetical protein
MKKKVPVSARRKKKASKKEEVRLNFRERKFRDIDLNPKHPDPIPGFVPTLPGPPGWMQKLNPGA